jgi:small-conductance mechanosensitive channel
MKETADTLTDGLARFWAELLGILPEALGALVLLVAGWLAAKLLRALTVRSAGAINRMIGRLGERSRMRLGALRDSSIRFIGEIVYWLVILFFLAAATQLLGLAMFAGWLDRLVAYLPNILSGLLIIFAGLVLANIARDAVMAGFLSMPQTSRAHLARIAQIGTMTVLVVVGIDQLGVDITVVVTVIGIALGGLLGGLALAFGLGARAYVSNLIGAHYLGRAYRPGERIRIGDSEGVILEITPVAVVLETGEGRLTVPARRFAEDAVLLMPNAGAHHG